MQKESSDPDSQYPPSNYLAAAIKNLPTPGPKIPPQTVKIDAGSSGQYLITFVVRLNEELPMPTFFWGIESGMRSGNVEVPPEASDPENGRPGG